MRLDRLTVSGFRGFADEVSFDLAADVVLLHGPNGAGKTSLLDAVLWGITGAVERLGSGDSIVGRYASLGEARVELSLRSRDGESIVVSRRYNGKQSLRVELEGEQLTGSEAESRLTRALLPEAAGTTDIGTPLTRAITRAIYLQQDQVRGFLDSEDEQSRFRIVAELIGAGRIGELLSQFESGRRAWTKATNERRSDLEPSNRRRDLLRSQIAQLEASAGSALKLNWRDWAERAARLAETTSPEQDSDPARLVDRLLGELRRAIRLMDDRIRLARELEKLVSDSPREVEQSAVVRAQEDQSIAERVRAEKANAVEAAQVAASARRRQQLLAEQDRESLATLAELALRHMGDRCPVCTQSHDRAVTDAHLRELLSAGQIAPETTDGEVQDAAAELDMAERALASSRTHLGEVLAARRRYADWAARVEALCADVGLVTSAPAEAASSLVDHLERSLSALQAARVEGEALLLDITRAAEGEKLGDYRAQLAELEIELVKRETELLLRDFAGDDAHRFHEALREVSESLVSDELKRMEPTLQRVYASVDPHPAFRIARFLTQTERGRGRLWTAVQDATQPEAVKEPSQVLSSSQLNVLAVSVFLAFNLTSPVLPLRTVILDDPLQSLDSVNLLGLADLMRRLRPHRQLVLSTHDPRLVGLLERKLRPIAHGQRTTVIEVDGWTRRGPSVHSRDVAVDAPQLRLLPSA